MIIPFSKYHGTGNDFIIIDDRILSCKISSDFVRQICNRRTGIGSDGLILLKCKDYYNFEMLYYNADGTGGSLCGNGGRCIVAFAHHLGLVNKSARFLAADGGHEAEIIHASDRQVQVKIKLNDVHEVRINSSYYFLNTGSPHYVTFVDQVNELDVYTEGKKIRYADAFSPSGTNVNFVEIFEDHIFVRTYERGVEDETLSCGTGITASTIATALHVKNVSSPCVVKSLGGELKVYFKRDNEIFRDIWLEGPATFVFKGEIEI